MLKLFMNEPFATSHELTQAKRLVHLLENFASHQHVWLCLNFNLGGKAIDGALITRDGFIILELKAVGGDVECGQSVENSSWYWRSDSPEACIEIKTAPYANPFSQIKSYRTAAIGELEHRQKGFLGNVSLMQSPTNFAWWVRGCVLMSTRTAEDVKVSAESLSHGTSKWFGCGTLGDVQKIVEGMSRTVTLSEKEIERLIGKVLGLKQVDAVIDAFDQKSSVEDGFDEPPFERIEVPANTALVSFMKRYGKSPATTPPKVVKPVAKIVETATNVVNDFADIDALFTMKPEQPITAEQNPADRNVTAADRPINRSFLIMSLQFDMGHELPDYGTMSEIEGQEAVQLVLLDFPHLSNFEVSKVVRFGNAISEESGGRMVQYFNEKYSPVPPWSYLTYAQEGIDFVFGREVAAPDSDGTDEQRDVPYERPIGTRFLMARWTRELVEKETEGLPPLTTAEVQCTGELSVDDVRRYAKTYFPRTCAEAFVVSDWLMGFDVTPSKVSILDVGCGCGGASLGCLLALHKHCATGRSEITLTGVDVNTHALAFARNLFENARTHFQGHRLSFATREGDMWNILPREAKYDVVIASKSIGELALAGGAGAYIQTVRLCSERVSDQGMLILIDIPKHRASMEKAVDGLVGLGFEGWLKSMSIALDGTSDSEEYVCACLSRGNSKEIRKE